MRVLYANHTGTMSGGELSLLTLLRALPDDVEPVVACPEGPLARAVAELGIPRRALPQADASLKLGVHTTKAVGAMARAAWLLRSAAGGADVVHGNSIRAGLLACGLPGAKAPPVVAHIRDCLPPGRMADGVSSLIGRRASVVLSNSLYTQRNFAKPRVRARLRVVHNAVDVDRFDPARIDRRRARSALGLDGGTLVLAVIGQITPWKGQDDAIRALAAIRDRGADAHLVIVGSAKFVERTTRFDNRSYERSLHALAESSGVRDRVSFLGERSDIPEIIRAADVVLVPSWEEPFGRVVVEGMAMGVPVLATSAGGPPEILTDGVEGRLLPPRQPERWATALEELAAEPEARAAMGQSGRERALAHFTPAAHVDAILAVYREAIANAAPG